MRSCTGEVAGGNRSLDQVILVFRQQLPSDAKLRLAFSYPLQEGLDGFYRSSYTGAARAQQAAVLPPPTCMAALPHMQQRPSHVLSRQHPPQT